LWGGVEGDLCGPLVGYRDYTESSKHYQGFFKGRLLEKIKF